DLAPAPATRRRFPADRGLPGRRARHAAVRRPGDLRCGLPSRLFQGPKADPAQGLIHSIVRPACRHVFPSFPVFRLPDLLESSMLQAYRQHAAERAALGIPPLPLDAQQVADLVELLKNPPAGEEQFLLDLLTQRVPAGVDEAAKVKASWLAALALGGEGNALSDRARATGRLGTMLGGYSVSPLIELLDDAEGGTIAADALKATLLVFDAFHHVEEKARAGNAN